MKPEIHIFKDVENLSRAAADLFVEQAAKSIAERDRFLVTLNGGNTPMRLFQLLATDFRDRVDWSKVHFFWGMSAVSRPMIPAAVMARRGVCY